MKERDYSIDIIRGILMILVVLGHGLEFLRKENGFTAFLYNFIYFFHMPVFVFITGFLSKNIKKGRNRAVQTYFVPFLLFNIIWSVITLLSSYFTDTSKLNSNASAYFTFFTPGWALWFMLSVFLWKIFLPDIVRIKNAFVVTLIIGLLSGLFVEFGAFMSLARTITFLPYFLAGYYCSSDHITNIRSKSKLWSILVFLAGGLITYIYGNVLKLPSEMLWGDRSYNHYIEQMLPALLITMVRYIVGFAFIFALINVIRGNNKVFAKIGANTLSVYFMHTYLVGPLMAGAGYIKNPFLQLAVICAGAFLITLILSSAPVARGFHKVIERLNSFIFKKDTVTGSSN